MTFLLTQNKTCVKNYFFFFFSSRRGHTRCSRDWSSDVCSSDLAPRPADERPGGHRAQKQKQMQLRILNREVEFVHQVERVVAHQACEIKELGKHQRHENREAPADLPAG